MNARDLALLGLLRMLAACRYQFTTPTPLTHSRVIARADRAAARTLADIFGWSLPFDETIVPNALLSQMQAAGVLLGQHGAYRSSIRVSSLSGDLFAHSSYPTLAADSIFFGPDTYRFARFVSAHLPKPRTSLRCVDIGCGSGAGAISTARLLPRSQWLLTDINAGALRLAAINASLAGLKMTTAISDVLADVSGGFDLVICNPPYLSDPEQRAYRHGGGGMGRELGLRIVKEAVARLNPGGRFLLYTGVAIVDGIDPFLAALPSLLDETHCQWSYSELDVDVFGEELDRPDYAGADRIAAVGLVVIRQLDGG